MRASTAGRFTAGFIALVATLVAAAPAAAHPVVSVPTIAGNAKVGAKLTASATVTKDGPATIDYTWLQCSASGAAACVAIPLATEKSYVVSVLDVGHRLAVRARATNAKGEQSPAERSALTAVVPPPVVPTPTPTPTPTPEPTVVPTPDPPPAPTPPADGSPATPAGGTDAAPAPNPLLAGLMDPFPVVRIRGVIAPRGARVSLLQVRGPFGATVSVRCEGRGCPRGRWSRGLGRIETLERFLRAGIRITIRVVRPGTIGKYVRFVIREGKAPYRRDACLLPGAEVPVKCPAV